MGGADGHSIEAGAADRGAAPVGKGGQSVTDERTQRMAVPGAWIYRQIEVVKGA
jgi:hypothetical protein